MRTTDELRKELKVTNATIANWIKTGVIPAYPNGRYFDDATYLAVIDRIKKEFHKLQKRANRSNNETNAANTSTITNSQTKAIIEELLLVYKQKEVSLSVFMGALSIFFLAKRDLIRVEKEKISCKNNDFSAFLMDWQDEENVKFESFFSVFDALNFPEGAVDFLGSTYESLRSLNEKAHLGAFFTPQEIISDIQIPTTATVLDPCAGTGTFLLTILDRRHSPPKITIRDIDALALKIAKVNFVLFFNQLDAMVNIEVKNILWDKIAQKKDLFSLENETEVFDFVITNPPYGAKLSPEEKNSLLLQYPPLKTTESFSIALYNCLEKLSANGKLHFILPESMLYVDVHIPIRKHIFSGNRYIKITHFGNAFKGVMSKIIRLDIENTRQKAVIEVKNKEIEWEVSPNILIKNNFRPPLIQSEKDTPILHKIIHSQHFTLEGKCKFGLGIVTGNNDAHLKENLAEGLEAIYTGKELQAFGFIAPKYFIKFDPKQLQQVAPTELYRQPKICYRFICESIIVLADFEGSLVLNSVNFFIPPPNISIKALTAFLNAEVVSFIYQRLYNTTKVLKNCFEHLPIPNSFWDNIDGLETIYEQGKAGEDVKIKLNNLVCRLYGLTETETNHILSNI